MKLGIPTTWICALAGVVLAALSATPAAAGDVAYLVTVDTHSVSGPPPGFIDFQFNPGPVAPNPSQPATAKIENFTSAGGILGVPIDTGSVTGVLPGTVTMTNSTPYNDLFQAFQYGSSFSFLLVLSGPALEAPNGTASSGSTFTLSLYDSGPGCILTNQCAGTGAAGTIDINLDGSTTPTAFPSSNAGAPPVVTLTPVALPGSYQIGYAANLQKGMSFIDLTNAGSAGGLDPAGNICANLYAFDAKQELLSCCACLLTPNHLESLSYQKDILLNLLTPEKPNEMTVAIVASSGAAGCDPSAVTPGQTVTGLLAWGTTIHALGGTYAATETEFLGASLSPSEFAKLTSTCSFIQSDGSSYGICKSCQVGALGAARQ